MCSNYFLDGALADEPAGGKFLYHEAPRGIRVYAIDPESGYLTLMVVYSNYSGMLVIDPAVKYAYMSQVTFPPATTAAYSIEGFTVDLDTGRLAPIPGNNTPVGGFIQSMAILPLCFQLLGGLEKMPPSAASPSADQSHSLWNCPVCGGVMRVVERLSAAQLLLRSPPQPDRCAALTLEPLFPPSASTRASARTQIPCLIRRKPLARRSLQPPHQPSASLSAASSGLHAIASHQSQPAPDPSAPAQPHAKYIGFREGGFLQVAVSEAPHLRATNCALLRRGALQIQH